MRSYLFKHCSLTVCLALCLAVGACMDVPALDDVGGPIDKNAPFPALIPLGPVVAQGTDPTETALDLQADLTARTARLQRRADGLRRSEVLDPEARQRLEQGLEQ